MIDYLSHSPSIVDVLSYLDYQDIPRIKLLSRHFRSLVVKNATCLARPLTKLSINFTDHMDLESTLIWYHPKDDFCRSLIKVLFITNCRIRLYAGCTREIQEHFEENARVFQTSAADEPHPEPVIKLFSISEAAFPQSYVDFHVDSLEDGLRRSLDVLFRRFNFSEITINRFGKHTSRKELTNWTDLFVDLGRRYRTICANLELRPMSNGHEIGPLLSALRCHCVYMFFSNPLSQLLPVLPIRHSKLLYVDISPANFDTFLPVVHVVKRWESGDIDRIGMFGVSAQGELAEWPFSFDFVRHSLACFNLVSVSSYEKKANKEFSIEVKIKRSLDDTVLRVTYSKNKGNLYIEEVK